MRILFSNHLLENPLISDNELDNMASLVNDYLGSTYKFEGRIISGGLACCILFDTLAISFNSNEKWNKTELSLEKNCEEKKVKHISKIEHIEYHNKFFNEIENDILKDITPKNLYSKLNSLFPNLRFAKELKKQVVNLANDINFHKILKILNKLNKDPTYLKDLNISPEGETVKNSEKLRKQRIFTFGEEKIFCEKHIKNFDSLRIHFEIINNQIYIGYIGNHLSNKNNP